MRQKGVTQTMRGRTPKGFTLVEVLIAILIFSLSLLALVPLLSTATSIDRENYLNVRARAMAADMMDSFMGGMSEAEAVLPANYGGNPSTVIDQGVTMTRQWQTPFPVVGNRETINVTVSYTYKGQLKTFAMTGQRAR
jgi:prepilin-type N-terminal cleavage/methylation domain-containing protein